MKKRYYDFLSLVFIGILYIFSVIRATLISMYVPVKSWHMLLLAAGALIFYCLIDTGAGRVIFFSSAGAGVCFCAYLIFRDGTSNLSETFRPAAELVNVAVKVGTGWYDESVPFSALMYVAGIYSVIVALPVYFFLVKRFRFYPLIIPGLAFFMTVWGINRDVDRLSIYIFITVAIVCYIRHTYKKNLKYSHQHGSASAGGNMLVYFIPVAIIAVLVSAAVPVSERPIEWPWLDKKIFNFWQDLQREFSIDRYDTFSLAETGFGNPSRLGGPVNADNTPVLLVEAPARVYLRGAVYDTYTGSGWEITVNGDEDYFTDRVYDHNELVCGWKAASVEVGILTADEFNNYLLSRELPFKRNYISNDEYLELLNIQTKPRILEKLFPRRKISVKHLNVRTKSLFTPLRMFIPVTGISTYTLDESAEGLFLADRKLRGGSTYNLDYLQPAYGMTELENYFNLSKPGLYSEFIERYQRLAEKYQRYDEQDRLQELTEKLGIYEELEQRSDKIYQRYTALPYEIPERVRTMAKEITTYDSTTYEKVKSLENYLRQNYNYTLTPAYPPPDQDFVDYFLFDGKEGYCSYFASALCVMARSIGIPARYVEGFLLPEKTDTLAPYQVTNRNAHAWVEVYLEGVGWVTFEPTPPMAGAQNYYVRLYETENGDNTFVPEPEEEYVPETPIQNVFIPGTEMNSGKSSAITLKIVIVSVGILLCVIIINMLFILIRRIFLHLLPPGKSVLLLYKYAVSLLSQAGNAIKTGETPKNYAEVVDERYGFSSMSMSEMADLYYSVRFGSHDADKKTLKRLFAFVSEIKAKTGRNMPIIKKFLYRYLLFKG